MSLHSNRESHPVGCGLFPVIRHSRRATAPPCDPFRSPFATATTSPASGVATREGLVEEARALQNSLLRTLLNAKWQPAGFEIPPPFGISGNCHAFYIARRMYPTWVAASRCTHRSAICCPDPNIFKREPRRRLQVTPQSLSEFSHRALLFLLGGCRTHDHRVQKGIPGPDVVATVQLTQPQCPEKLLPIFSSDLRRFRIIRPRT